MEARCVSPAPVAPERSPSRVTGEFVQVWHRLREEGYGFKDKTINFGEGAVELQGKNVAWWEEGEVKYPGEGMH
eukprot:2171110-Pyramimonas_sp.AAC.1